MDSEKSFAGIMTPWTESKLLDEPIYRYISIEEFATVIELQKARLTRLDKFGDPWDSESFRHVATRDYLKSGEQFSKNNSFTSFPSTTLRSIVEPKDPSVANAEIAKFKETRTKNYILNSTKTGNPEISNLFDADFKRIKQETFAWCWTLNGPETMSMWMTYASSPTSLCIKSTPRQILKQLEPYQPKLFGKVSYSKDIPESLNYIPFSKLNSYEFEQEFRFVYTNSNVEQINLEYMSFNFNFPRKSEICFHPDAKRGYVSMIRNVAISRRSNLGFFEIFPNQNNLE